MPCPTLPIIGTNSDRIPYTRATRGGTAHHYAYRNSDEQYYECRRYPFCQPLRTIGRNGRFKESVPTLDARQLINEQIQSVTSEIPSELGTPEMMPITTGLGEIYQYILKVAPGYEKKYDAMELRTIQDWMVKRQLSGIPGIVEINSFGGYLKQYEVAVDPDALFSLNITIGEVFEALSSNNQNTGGSYIEKIKNAYYIRSEGMITRIKDIEQI